MALTTTTAAEALREHNAPGFTECLYKQDDSWLRLFGPWGKWPGDTNYRWKAHKAGQTPEVFVEGQGQPSAGNQDFEDCAVAWTYFRGMIEISGHAYDALGGSPSTQWFDHIEEESSMLREDIVDLIVTSFMGSTYGLEKSVDYGDTYAGVTRNSAAGWFEATETAVSGSLSTDDMIDLQETVRDNDKGGQPQRNGIWLCSLNQESNIYRLGGPHVIHNSNPSDKFPGIYNQRCGGIPVAAFGDWSNTVIMLLDLRPGNFATPVIRPFHVLDMGANGDTRGEFQFSWGGALICKQPRFQGKLTGVTA